MAERKFLDFLDMIDGGGAGMSGDRFEGGGLLSLIGNALFQPTGYRERQRPQAPPVGFLDMQPTPTSALATGPVGAGAGADIAGPGRPGGPVPQRPTSALATGPVGAGAGAGDGVGMAGPGMPGGPVLPMPTSSAQTIPTSTAPAIPTDPRALPPHPIYAFNLSNSQGMVNGQMPQEFPTPLPISMGSMMSQLDAVLTPDQRRELEKLPIDRRMGVIERLMQMYGM